MPTSREHQEFEQRKPHHPDKPICRAMFICKQSTQESSNFYGYFRKYSGLFISARLVSNMLVEELEIESKCVVAKDNNDIDKLVHDYRPTHVFIEAFWVVPEKFEVLARLHPNVKWIVRVHSETPFFALEGMSMEWALRYLDYPNVYLAPNAYRIFEDLKTVLKQKYDWETIREKLMYLPNYYPPVMTGSYEPGVKRHIDIGCFGSVRPLKNQLVQAIAAMKFADMHGLKMHFHINSNRVEMNGSPVLRNLRCLFEAAERHKLVEHAWMPHHEFKDLISRMEIGMQVSFTETFNIVTADFVTQGVPVVASKEVFWLPEHVQADPTNSDDIVDKLNRVWHGRLINLQKLNLLGLRKYSNTSIGIWNKYMLND
jgi:hypothetical protein